MCENVYLLLSLKQHVSPLQTTVSSFETTRFIYSNVDLSPDGPYQVTHLSTLLTLAGTSSIPL